MKQSKKIRTEQLNLPLQVSPDLDCYRRGVAIVVAGAGAVADFIG